MGLAETTDLEEQTQETAQWGRRRRRRRTSYPTPFPTPSPTAILQHKTCKVTYCTYSPKNTIKGHPGAVTDIFSMGKEIFHCEKVGTKCRCVCDRSLKCALRHHHESGYKKSFTHC